MRKLSMLAMLILLDVGVIPLANAAHIITDLSTLSGINSEAIAINNTGQIVGI